MTPVTAMGTIPWLVNLFGFLFLSAAVLVLLPTIYAKWRTLRRDPIPARPDIDAEESAHRLAAASFDAPLWQGLVLGWGGASRPRRLAGWPTLHRGGFQKMPMTAEDGISIRGTEEQDNHS